MSEPQPSPGALSPEALSPSDLIGRAEVMARESARLLAASTAAEQAAIHTHGAEHRRLVDEAVHGLPLDALRTASDGRLRLGALEDAGFRTVAQVLAAGSGRLDAVDGVGPRTADQAMAAASQVADAVARATRVRFDVERRPPSQTALLDALRHHATVAGIIGPLRPKLERATTVLPPDIGAAGLETRRLRRLFAGRARREAAAAALGRLAGWLSSPTVSAFQHQLAEASRLIDRPIHEPADVWDDFLARPVHYNSLLVELAGAGDDTAAVQGFLPGDIVEAIGALELDTSLLRVSLRGYQSFGARFALVQRRTILGDEMGLGKTIQALAVLCHLRAAGATHFLVVSPASVLANWEHEIARHSALDQVWRLHGPDRDEAVYRWRGTGGIGLTTYDTLRALPGPGPLGVAPAAVVVDEAHYVKNPEAQRTRAVASWLNSADHVLLMSGTPMENRVEEFRVLVDHIRPDVAAGIRAADSVAGADSFRRAVAPVYLRRNQIDVLDELPSRIETPEWLRLEGPAAHAYREAVIAGNFMAMRRAAFLTEVPGHSPKLTRLLEIVEEAVDNNRKVIVFSFFRDVIARVCEALGPLALDPLTGDVPPTRRQELVDRFTAHPEPLVLVSQIEAGGVGLNIQAASVVILTEPQWKPSVEDQAIARAHRMGQVRPVEVHRLLTENSVDEHMVAVLARKSALFADYVELSAMKDAAAEAIDVTDADLVAALGRSAAGTDGAGASGRTGDVDAVTVAAAERQIMAAERARLGLPDGPTPPSPAGTPLPADGPVDAPSS